MLLTPLNARNEVDLDALDAIVDLYVGAGVAGLFTSCLSSEVFDLSAEERLEITRRVCRRAAGKIAVVAGGNFGVNLEEQAHSLTGVYQAGADVAVALISILPSRKDLGNQLMRLAELTSVPLGVYECPEPEHRLLSPEEVGRLAWSGRFIFMKEASRNVEISSAKIRAAEGSPLRVFQANLKCTPDTLAAGASGHAGVVANICPEMCQAYCDGSVTDPDRNRRIYESMQLIHDLMVGHSYPASGKYILHKRGLPITSFCRTVETGQFSKEDRRVIDSFLQHFDFSEPLSDDQLLGLRAAISSATWMD